MILNTTHKVWWAEVESRAGTLADPLYTLVSITPGVTWRQESMRLRRQSTGVDLIPAEPGDPVLVKDFNGTVKAYGWTGIPFDQCGSKAQAQDDGNTTGDGGLTMRFLRLIGVVR